MSDCTLPNPVIRYYFKPRTINNKVNYNTVVVFSKETMDKILERFTIDEDT